MNEPTITAVHYLEALSAMSPLELDRYFENERLRITNAALLYGRDKADEAKRESAARRAATRANNRALKRLDAGATEGGS